VTKVFEAFGKNTGVIVLWESAVMKKDEAVSWLQQRICGWFREVMVNGGCWGVVEPNFA
jgi:hypothetical protein